MHRVAEEFGKKIHAASKALKKLAKPKSQTDSLRAAQELRELSEILIGRPLAN